MARGNACSSEPARALPLTLRHLLPSPGCSIPDPLFRGVKISGFWLMPYTNRWAGCRLIVC